MSRWNTLYFSNPGKRGLVEYHLEGDACLMGIITQLSPKRIEFPAL